jgi:hypothetical protein
MKEIQYFINEEKGIIVAKMTKDYVEDALMDAYEKIGKTSKYGGVIVDEKVFSKFVAPITAIATCSEDDAFDVEIGKAIARKKALAKLAIKKAKLCWAIADIYNRETIRIVEMAQRESAKAISANDEVYDYIKEIFE